MTFNWILTFMIVVATVIFGSWWLKGKELHRSHERRESNKPVLLTTLHLPKTSTDTPMQLAEHAPPLVLVLSANSVKRSVLSDCIIPTYWQLNAHQLTAVSTITALFSLDAVVVDIDSFSRETHRELWQMLSHCGQAGYTCYALSAAPPSQYLYPASTMPYVVSISKPEVIMLLSQIQQSRQQHLQLHQQQRQALLPLISHSLLDREQKFIHRFWELLQWTYTDAEFGLEQAAQGMAMSSRQLNRVMKDIFGVTFVKYLQAFRVYKAKALLQQGMSVTAVVFEVGFSNPSLFSRVYKNHFGYPPSKENG